MGFSGGLGKGKLETALLHLRNPLAIILERVKSKSLSLYMGKF